MRNLKKVLSLALALVMLLGMMMVGAGAATTTSAGLSEANEEAIAVLKATKVMTNKRYGDPVTRAEAAKMVLTIYNPDLAKGVKNTKDSAYFSDVKNHWAAGYIDLCFVNGIVSGKSKTVFDPNGSVKGYELAKMILVAMGSEKKYTGSTWTSKVMQDIVGLKLGTDTKISNWNAPVTRVQAAQLTFNGMITPVDGQKEVFVVTAKDGTELYRGDDAITASVIKSMNADSKIDRVSDTTGSLGAQNFALKQGTDTDAFGHVTNVWTMNVNGKDAKVARKDSRVTKVYTGEVKTGTIYADLGLSKTITGNTSATDKNTWTYDGVNFVYDATPSNPTHPPVYDAFKFVLAKDGKQVIGNSSTVTEVYYDGTNVQLVTTTTYPGKVTKVNEAKDDKKANVELTVFGIAGGLTFETEGFAKDQYVLVTLSKTPEGRDTTDPVQYTIQSVEAATVIEKGVVTGASDTAVVVDGVSHKYAKTNSFRDSLTAAGIKGAVASKTAYTFVLDQQDQIIAVAAGPVAGVPTDFVYIAKLQTNSTSDNLAGDTNAWARASATFTDGTSKVIELAIKRDGNDYKYNKPATDGTVDNTATLATANATPIGNWFAYTVNDDKYTLTAVDPTVGKVLPSTGSDVTLTANVPTQVTKDSINKWTTNTTKIVGFKDGKTTTVNGLPTANLTLDVSEAQVLVTYAKDSSVIAGIYAFGQNVVVTAASKDYAYCLSADAGMTYANGTEYTFAIKGEKKTVIISGAAPAKGNIYTLTEQTDGSFTTGNALSTELATGTVVMADANNLIVGSNAYTNANGYEVYNVSANHNGEADTLEAGDTVTVVKNSSTVLAVYITAEKA